MSENKEKNAQIQGKAPMLKIDNIHVYYGAIHALKGVSANLGLVKISELAAQVTEEFRPGASRRLSDAEVAQAIARIGEMYQKTAAAIKQYMEG